MSHRKAKVIDTQRWSEMAFGELLHEENEADARPRMTGDAFWSNTTITRLFEAVRPLIALVPSTIHIC
jgi:hypothetical protein